MGTASSTSLETSQGSRRQSGDSASYAILLNFPIELVIEILSYVPAYDLNKHCKLVCKLWRDIVNDHVLWIRKCTRENKYMPKINLTPVPKDFYRMIYLKNPYGRNLISNPSGEDNLQHWTVEMNGGDGWCVEKPPHGADPLPFDENHGCFATSFYTCRKSQTIDLIKEGVLPEVMDIIKPDIEVSEWYAARFDCGSIYELVVRLLDEHGKQLDVFKFKETQEQWAGSHWARAHHVFSNYPEGVRVIVFTHTGCDTQFWKGYYGSKMTEASVKLLFH